MHEVSFDNEIGKFLDCFYLFSKTEGFIMFQMLVENETKNDRNSFLRNLNFVWQTCK